MSDQDQAEPQISDREFAARFEAARQLCFTGHQEGCTYGGLTPPGGFWLVVATCSLTHGEACVICGGEPEAAFGDWAQEDGELLIWGLRLCSGCRDRELARRPGKWLHVVEEWRSS